MAATQPAQLNQAVSKMVLEFCGLFFLVCVVDMQRLVLARGAAAWGQHCALLQLILHSVVHSWEPWVFAFRPTTCVRLF